VSKVVEEDRSRPFLVCPTLLVVLYDPSKRAPASEGDFLGIISLGCMMENLWLAANSLGIDFHIVSALGSGPVEKEVKRILAVPEHLKIAFSVRLGYAAVAPSRHLRVRRDIQDFSHHNHFGNKGID
jgi:nitroreductase